MVEGAITGVQPVEMERPKDKRLENLGKRVEKIGKKFIGNKFSIDYWEKEIKNLKSEDGVIKKGISLAQESGSDQLSMIYDKKEHKKGADWELNQFVFHYGEGQQSVGLRKGVDNNWEIVRTDKEGTETVAHAKSLRPEELKHLSPFLFNLQKDIAIQKIIDAIDHDKRVLFTYTVIATVALGFAIPRVGAYLDKISTVPRTTPALATPSTVSENASAPDEKPTINPLDPGLQSQFDQERQQALDNFYRPENGDEQAKAMGLIYDLGLVTRLFQPNNIYKDGPSQEKAIRNFLMTQTDSNGRYNWRKYISVYEPSNLLMDPFEQALAKIKKDKWPYSQNTVYSFLDAVARTEGQSIVTPEKIMAQTGIIGNIDNITAANLWQNYWNMGPEVFNVGPIKGYSVLPETVMVGDTLVSKDSIGKVINITSSKDNGLMITVWQYDEGSGKMRLVKYDTNNFPKNALAFTYETR